jgi:hypothetical protein
MNIKKLLFFFIICLLCGAALAIALSEEEKYPLTPGDEFYYTTNDKIYKIMMPDNKKAIVVYDPSAEGYPKQDFRIMALTGGPGNTLLFVFQDLTNFPHTKETVASYDLGSGVMDRSFLEIPGSQLGNHVLAPDGSKLAALTRNGRLVIKNLKDSSIEYHDYFRGTMAFPESWSPDGTILTISDTDIAAHKTRILFVNTVTGEIKVWKNDAVNAIFSPSGKRIAYLDSDRRNLIVSDVQGTTIRKFGGYGYLSHHINGWIDEDKVLFTKLSNIPYTNHIGIADVATGKIYAITVPHETELSGIWYRKARGQSGK